MHVVAAQLSEAFARVISEVAPGQVSALYIVGSAALDDFHPRHSDLDFVAVGTLDEEAARRINIKLRVLPEAHRYEGLIVSPDDLGLGPLAMQGPRWVVSGGKLHVSETSGQRNPVAWATIAQRCCIALGPPPLKLWRDDAALRAWIVANVDNYWRASRERRGKLFTLPGIVSMTPWFAAWSVLGLARMHATMTTEAIISKSSAADYARTAFDARWMGIIDDAARVRRNGRSRLQPLNRRDQTLAFMDMAIDAILGMP